MSYSLFRFVSGVIVLGWAAAPSSATVVSTTMPTLPSQLLGPVQQQVGPRRGAPRYVRLPRSQKIISVSTPAGCLRNGVFSFVGGGTANFAGGGTGTPTGYAGVVEGTKNEACDLYSMIGAGWYNIVGGDGGSEASAIAGGKANAIEAVEGFIGAGDTNLISPTNDFSYPNADYSAIVSGQQNTISSPLSFIGGGYSNSITIGAFGTATNGMGSFIGAGSGNRVGNESFGGNFSAVVSGQSNVVNADNSTIVGGNSNLIIGSGTEGTFGSSDASIVGGTSNSMGQANSFIGGGTSNKISTSLDGPGAVNSVITGGGNNAIGFASVNTGEYSVISGGYSNTIGAVITNDVAQYGAIGGGSKNVITGNYAAIAGGSANSVSGTNAAIGGGSSNSAAGTSATVGGGAGNSASGAGATVGGGTTDSAVGNNAAIAGGYLNKAAGNTGAIGGGYKNVVSGAYATIPGGAANVAAGTNSFAAGTLSNAAHNGAFVWSDNSTSPRTLASTAANQFLARAAGGFYLYSAANLSAGVKLAPGSGSWSSVSDRAAKTAIEEIDDERILAKVAALPVSEWSYSAQGTGIRHLGPMAQDFKAAFGLGEDDRHIAVVDEEGVALAAIKGLRAELAEKDRQLDDLRHSKDRQLDEMRRANDEKFARVEARLQALEEHLAAKEPQSGK